MEELLQEAFTYHQAGQLKEAEEIYLEILEQDSQQADALHLLGMIAYHSKNFAKALDYYQQAIASDDTIPQFFNSLGNGQLALNNLKEAQKAYEESFRLAQRDANVQAQTEASFNLGLLLSQQNQPQAVEYFKQALEIQPDFYPAYNNLGLYYKQQGELDKAIEVLEQGLELAHPDEVFDIHNNLGNAYYLKGDYTQAQEHYEAALALHSHSATLYHNLGNLYRVKEEWKLAKKHYLKSLELQPLFAETYLNMGYMAHALQENFEEILEFYVKAYLLDSSLEDALLKFSDCFKYVTLTNDNWRTLTSEPYQHVLEKCLAYPTLGVDKQGLVRNAVVLLSFDPAFRKLFQSLVEQDFSQIALDITCFALDGLFHNKIFLELLTHTIITQVDFEKMLTILRRIWLSLWQETPEIFKQLVVHYEPFLIALAHQSFNNEYVYWVSPEEEELVGRLQADIQATGSDTLGEDPLKVLIFACYRPLEDLGINQALEQCFQDLEWQGLLKKCLRDREVERALLQGFEASEQELGLLYDQNPYPRWFSLNRFTPDSLEQILQELFPLAQLDFDRNSSCHILIAGCGTGRHAIRTSTRFSQAEVLGIDVSAVSLAYAQRMTRELAIDSITYRQLDIKQVSKLNQCFDVIECLGVLHHFQDPEPLLSVLVDSLKPQGFLKLGLFSKIARECVGVARQFVKELQVPQTLEGLHHARQTLLHLPVEHPAAEIIEHSFSEFHSTSACWHLLFEDNERQFDLGEIRQLLARLGLTFVGFETQQQQLFRDYQAFNPSDLAAQDLERWADFEEENRHSFLGMYQFWCQKS